MKPAFQSIRYFNMNFEPRTFLQHMLALFAGIIFYSSAVDGQVSASEIQCNEPFLPVRADDSPSKKYFEELLPLPRQDVMCIDTTVTSKRKFIVSIGNPC